MIENTNHPEESTGKPHKLALVGTSTKAGGFEPPRLEFYEEEHDSGSAGDSHKAILHQLDNPNVTEGDTYIFKLLSGVEVEIFPFTGKHEEALTKGSASSKKNDLQSRIQSIKRMNKMVKMLIKRVGSKTGDAINDELVSSLLLRDRNWLLLHAHLFLEDFETEWEFNYKFKNPNTKKSKEYPVNIDLRDYTRQITIHPNSKDCKEYEDVLKHNQLRFTLPKKEKDMVIFSPVVAAESELLKHNLENVSSLHIFQMHNPCFVEKNNDGTEKLVRANMSDLRNLKGKDTRTVRKKVEELNQYKFDLQVEMENPFTAEPVTLDLLGLNGFLSL